MALSLRGVQILLREAYGCLPHRQFGRNGSLEVLSTSAGWRTQHTAGDVASLSGKAPEVSQATATATAASTGTGSSDSSSLLTSHQLPTTDPQDNVLRQRHHPQQLQQHQNQHQHQQHDKQLDLDLDEPPLPPLRFVSREQRTARQLPARRIPICFPNLTLQMLKLRDSQMVQLRETGWLREVAFKTTADVTKLEIAAYLESVYGMSVERVHTVNYLGRARQDAPFGKNRRHLYREDDWKKAYVVFRPPPGAEHLLTQEQQGGEEQQEEVGVDERPVIEQIREAARAPRPAPRPLPWGRRRQ